MGLFLIGNHNQVFAHHFHVFTEFKSIDTLEGGAKIRVSGMDAGEISGIAIPGNPSGKFRLTLSIDQKFHHIVRQDSVTTIETEGMVGSKYVNVVAGTANSPECEHGVLPSQQPDNPIMVEGYAEGGTASQRYLAAQERASEVERYLEAHFHLKPELLGTIALAGKPPPGSGEEAFDGVCLALVRWH